ncbi:TPA: glycosyltransferase family 4 protein [Photobacterium damselae]
MKVLHITRNIPVKNLTGNRIILEVIKQLDMNCKILFPAEYIPKLPFLKGRFSVFSELNGLDRIENNHILFYKFIRIFKGFDFLFSRYCLNYKNVEDYISDCDIYHAHYIFPDGEIALKFKRKYNKPYIVTVRQGDIDRINKINKNNFYYNMYYDVLLNADRVISVNCAINQSLKEKFNISSNILPHGIDVSKIRTINKTNKKVKIVTCGNFIKRKNIDWVIKSYAKLKTKYNCELTVIGSGDELNNLKKIDESVIFTGWLNQNEVLNILSESDVFILPSDNETFGMVYLEAATQGCMIIGKKNTGVYGLFDQDVCDYFVDDEIDLENKLNSLLNNKDIIDYLKIKAQKNVIEYFSWDVIKTKYYEIYNGVLGDSNEK